MNILKLFLCTLFLSAFQTLCAVSLVQEWEHVGYVEFCNAKHGAAAFDTLYARFDELIEFLQTNPVWAQKLYNAKERFIRSKDRNFYSTDFFGFYDESKKERRSQISFYYSTHFHAFICSYYPEFNQISEITNFLQACCDIQKPYGDLFEQAAAELGIASIFDSEYGYPPILFKVIKYLPCYVATKPHYDGTVFTFFLDSTDNQSLLLSPYKSSFSVDDFVAPVRIFSRLSDQNSLMLIPGTLLADFAIQPTPHIVMHSDETRHAAIAFAMRPHHISLKNEFTDLPSQGKRI